MQEHNIGQVNEFSEGQLTLKVVEGHELLVTIHKGEWVAFKNACPHLDLPLEDARLTAKSVVCNFHGWEFELPKGNCLTQPSACLKTYPVRIEGENVFLGLE